MNWRLCVVVVTYLLLTPALLGSVSAQAPARAPVPDLAIFSDALEDLSRRVGPTVVQIFVSGYVPQEGRRPPGEQLLPTLRSRGSGVIVDGTGHIVTNAHVVQGAARVRVELSGAVNAPDERRSILRPRGRLLGAQIVGVDRETDLTVLQVEAVDLPFLTLGDSDGLRMGQVVMAFGSPLGLANSATLGVVSSAARQLEPDDPMIYIQTDASINPGNSGGPLVDTAGRVVGINTLILSQSGGNEGIGFAAPSNIVKNVYEQIRKFGRVRRGELGANPQTITPSLAAGLGLTRDWGVVLSDVFPGGPAARAGLLPGDVVVSLDRKPMENASQFRVNLYSRAVGDTVRLEVLRGARPRTFFVAVVERADDPQRFQSLIHPDRHLVSSLGILGLDLDANVRAMLPSLRQPTGVVVAAVTEDAVLARDGALYPGDVIYAVNRHPIPSLAELRQVLTSLVTGDPVVVHVERAGTLHFVAFVKE